MTFEAEITKELCAMTGKENIRDSLLDLRMLSESHVDFSLIADKGWYRGGAETYCLDFTVQQDDTYRRYIIKALVAFSPGTAPDYQRRSWMKRREHLERIGIPVCRLIGEGRGAFIEEFLDLAMNEWIDELKDDERRLSELLFKISEYCGALAKAGYNPICILPNFRVQNGVPLWVDFGSDLGDPVETPIAPAILLSKLKSEWSWHNDERNWSK
jgi:hypothetical protein